MSELQDTLPPGWECRLDSISGKFYYVNHLNKLTTWDDPRIRSCKPVHAPLSATPKHFSNVTVEHIPLQEFRSTPRMSPFIVRSPKIKDSTFIANGDSEEAVAKISAMFPTVTETHIKMLMKKYHSREALVISALQVEKNPITTPGPFATPPPQRNIHHPNVYALHLTPPLGLRNSSRGGSPILRPGSETDSTYTGSPRIGDAYRSSPRPHSSPKLKLRYMKSLFPQAEETVILDALYNNESNIQKTTEVLKDMGFLRKDTVKAAQQKLDAKIEADREVEAKKSAPPPPPIKAKSTEEKASIKQRLKNKYEDVADRLIEMALDSVDFNENRAGQIIDIMLQEDTESSSKAQEQTIELEIKGQSDCEVDAKVAQSMPISQSRQSLKSLMKADRVEKEKNTFSRVVEESTEGYMSENIVNTKGHNTEIIQGPNEKLLLVDYVEWKGPNTAFNKGSQSLAKGPNRSLLSKRSYQPCGSNSELRRGPKFGLAKGSIFSQLKSVLVGESRAN